MLQRLLLQTTCVALLVSCLAFICHGQPRSFLFTVLDENGTVRRGVTASDVELQIGKTRIIPESVEAKVDLPLELLILVDASVSQMEVIEDGKKAVAYIIKNILHDRTDKIAIASFSGKMTLVHPMNAAFSQAENALKGVRVEAPSLRGVSSPNGQGATLLLDSIQIGIESLGQRGSTGTRKVLLVVTDGVNTLGSKKLDTLVAASISAEVSVFAVGIGDPMYDGVDRKSLRQITDATNGLAIVPKRDLADLPALAQTLRQMLRFAYEIKFDPSGLPAPSKKDDLRVVLVNPELAKGKLKIIQQQFR